MKIIVLICFLCFSVFSAHTEPLPTVPEGGEVKGFVYDQQDIAKPGVPVEIKGPSGKTFAFTNNEGAWSVYNLPAGKYSAEVLGEEVNFEVEQTRWWNIIASVYKHKPTVLSVPAIRLNDQSPME